MASSAQHMTNYPAGCKTSGQNCWPLVPESAGAPFFGIVRTAFKWYNRPIQ